MDLSGCVESLAELRAAGYILLQSGVGVDDAFLIKLYLLPEAMELPPRSLCLCRHCRSLNFLLYLTIRKNK